jgi:intracellular multiplication protein IcmP
VLHHPSANGGRAAWASSDDYIAISLVIILIGLGFGAYQAWINYHAEISWAVFHLQHWKMQLIAHVTDQYAQQDASVLRAHPERATIWQLLALLDNVGRFFRIPAGVLMLLLAAACYRWAAPARFCRQFDLAGLRREQARFFRAASAALGRRLQLAGMPKGEPRPADPALRPDEWVERYAQRRDGSLDETAAKRALIRQLGPKWESLDKAAPHVRWLFAAFALHLAGRRKATFALLGDMAEALAPMPTEAETGPAAPLTFPAALVHAADRLLRDPDVRRPALQIAAGHAYTTTALMSVLNEARRRSGVLPPAAFSGLKLVDRPLWYALHSLGFPGDGPGQNIHPNPRVEAAGARDHWVAEKAVHHKLSMPSVGQALASIRTAWHQHGSVRSEQSGSR